MRRSEGQRGVSAQAITIRLLGAGDAALYRDIRLEGLAQHPDAFSSAFETEKTEPLSRFAERLESSDVFGAFRGGELLGVLGFFIHSGPKRAHKGALWGLYVRPQGRRAGIGRQLMEAAVAHAGLHVELVQLTVTSSNRVARRLYASLGFIEYGIETNALKVDGRYYDDVLMAKALTAR
jgi:ribosomal protein S18 acetylase RimI-like enzyme